MEQMILPRLSEPHMPVCFGTGDFAAQPYVVIERIPGKTLYGRLWGLPLSFGEAGGIVGKIALGAGRPASTERHPSRHQAEQHHVSPLGRGGPDRFWLVASQPVARSAAGRIPAPYGTAPYMAPERLLGVRDDPRSDLFSLGVLWYIFTTGVRPFGESETMRGMRRRLWRDPHPPRKLKQDYPPWLQEVVLRCLEIEPVWRHPTAAQLAF